MSATSYAEVEANVSACIIALQAAGTGVTLSGGTSVTAAGCAIASDNTVSVPCGTSITTKTLDYNSSAVPSQPCSGIKPPTGTASVNIVKAATSDPLASNAAVTSAFSHLASVATLTAPAGPTVPAGTTVIVRLQPSAGDHRADRDRMHRQLRFADLDGHLPGGRNL